MFGTNTELSIYAVSSSRVVVTLDWNIILHMIGILSKILQKQENKNIGMTCQKVYKQGKGVI